MTLGVTFDWASTGLLNQSQNKNSYSFGNYNGSVFGTSSYSTSNSYNSSSNLQKNIEAVESMVANGYSVDDAIKELDIDETYVDDVKAYFSVGTDEQEAWISNYMLANGCSRAEAIAKYNEKYEIDCDTAISTTSYGTKVSTEKTLNEGTIKYISDEIYDSREYANGWFWTWGKNSNESIFEEYFSGSKLGSADMVAVAVQFKADHESLSDVLDYTFKNDDEKRTQYQEVYAKALIEQAKAGNEDAITLLCEEIKSCGRDHGVVEAFMKNADKEVLKLISEKYGMSDLIKRTEDMFDDKEAEAYVKAIKDANID